MTSCIELDINGHYKKGINKQKEGTLTKLNSI